MVEGIDVFQKAKDLKDQLIYWRRQLHKYPELSFQEKKTSLFLQVALKEMGVSFSQGWADTGIVGILKGNLSSDRVIALRADMDALPIQEKNAVEYQSSHPGCMHACGHDVHMSCLLGAIKILKDYQDFWGGHIKFIFQPGEELLPGGASQLISEGVLKNPEPDLIIGQHVSPGMAVGEFGVCPGGSMASSDEIYITIQGKGGHAAQAHLGSDTVYACSSLIVAMQTTISREKPALVPSILSFGKIYTVGGATNILPDEVKIEGTFRSLHSEWRNEAHTILHRICDGISKAHNVQCELLIKKGYPVLQNDPLLARKFLDIGNQMGSGIGCIEIGPRLTSEDFAYYSHEIPALFYRLGVGYGSNVHQADFTIDEDSLIYGSAMLAWLGMRI